MFKIPTPDEIAKNLGLKTPSLEIPHPDEIAAKIGIKPNITYPANFVGPVAPGAKYAPLPPLKTQPKPATTFEVGKNLTPSQANNAALVTKGFDLKSAPTYPANFVGPTIPLQKNIPTSPGLIKSSVDAFPRLIGGFAAGLTGQPIQIGRGEPILPITKQFDVGQEKYGKYLGPLVVGAGLIGDALTVLPGGEKTAAETIVRITNEGEALRFLARLGVSDDIARAYAPRIVKAATPEEAKALLTAMKSLENTTKVAGPTAGKVVPKVFPDIKPVAPTAAKEYGFVTTVKDSANTAKRQILADRIKGGAPTITNQATLDEIHALVQSNPNEALRLARETTPSARSFTAAEVLADKFAKEGNFELAIDLVESTAAKARQAGQANQALSMYSRLTPEGVLQFAQRTFNQANEALPKGKQLKLSPDLITTLRNQAEGLTKLPEGSREKAVATAEMLKTIADQVPTGFWKKVSLTQTMGQLLNPKTLLRNIIGNTGFAALENVKDVVATPLDWITSMATGKRTKTLPSLIKQGQGFKKGLAEGFEDAWKGIDTSAVATQFDLPKSPVFKNKVMSGLEKTMNIVLKSPDRAAYQATFTNSLAEQMKLAKVAEATPEMLHQAHLDGLYRTFQDDSLAARAFVGIKKALNLYQDFGIGDFVLKYPKTPGNLLARGIDYSPAGFFKTVIELGKPLFGKEFNQRAFVEATSRALTGTAGLVGTGALLHKLGIITGGRAKDNDINALQRATGLGQYKINLSGLARFITTGFNADEAKLKEGDHTISYDWFQPLAIGLSIGANIDETKGDAKGAVGTLIASIGSGADTLAEQPLVQGLTRPLRYAETISDAFKQAAQGIPTSFIPTLSNQIRQLVDRNQRNTQDANYSKETLNLVKNKLPGLSKSLPQKYGTFGEPLKNEQGPISTFINPAFLDKYITTPEQKMVLDIYNNSGETKQAPRLVSATQTISVHGDSKTLHLSGQQQSDMQKMVGELTKERFTGLAANTKFQKLSDEEKAQKLADIMSDINTAVKFQLLGHRPEKLSSRAKDYIRMLRQKE